MYVEVVNIVTSAPNDKKKKKKNMRKTDWFVISNWFISDEKKIYLNIMYIRLKMDYDMNRTTELEISRQTP